MTPNRAMGSVPTRCENRHQIILSAEVRAHAFCRLNREQICSARRKPGHSPEGWPAVPHSLLRNAEDQTIAAVAAVHGTLLCMGSKRSPLLEHWGISGPSSAFGPVEPRRHPESFSL